MDPYLASRELNQASHFYLNINFELLNGCKLKCPGCHVEKNGQLAMSKQDYANFEKLLNELAQNRYRPFIAFVGPTDFLSADNFVEVLSDTEIKRLFHKFTRLSIQTTYLDIKKSKLAAAVLRDHYSDLEIEINIVVDPGKIMDDKYLSVLEQNKAHFLSLIGREDIKTFGIMNVYDYDQTKIPQLLRDYEFMHHRVSHLFETTIDYNFSFGRNPDITNEEFLRLSHRIKHLFDCSLAADNISGGKDEYLRFSFGKLTDSLIERQYNYRHGRLYYSPLLYERFVSFRESFEVPLKDFSVKEIEEYEMNMQINQFNHAPDKEECESCPFLASCVDRGILHLMDTFNTKQCLVAKKALFAIKSMGTLPIAGHTKY